jgi:hypothetical protein
LVCLADRANAQLVTTRESVDSSGLEANSGSTSVAISADGRSVAFASFASNLVLGDTNGTWDIFLRDRQSGTTTRVSVRSDGTQADNWSNTGPTSISANGMRVAFSSLATNLVAGDTNHCGDVFVHDRQSGVTTRVSVDSSGGQADNTSGYTSISGDGRLVAFSSYAGNLAPGIAGGTSQVFVRDLQASVTRVVSANALGAPANSDCWLPVVSGDGRVVAFHSAANNLVSGDNNGTWDVFVCDLTTGVISRASVDSSGVEGNQYSSASSLSFDGRYVAFQSLSSNLVVGDTNGVLDVFVHDVLTGTTQRASVDPSGAEGNQRSTLPSLSADGSRVAFQSLATNFAPGTLGGAYGVFVHDLNSGSTVRVDVGVGGLQACCGSSVWSSSSGTGRFIAYYSDAMNLIAADSNNSVDVFVTDLGAAPITSYCTAGTTTNNCVPAISGSGNPSASAGTGFTISVQLVEGSKQGLVFYGINNNGFLPHSWGTSASWLCSKSPLQRTPPQNSGGSFGQCDGALSIDFNSFLAAHPLALGQPFSLGQQVFAQAWFRDPPSPKTTMLSDALQFFVEP